MLSLWRAARARPLVLQLTSVGVVAVLVVLVTLTVRQIPVWHDSLALWRHAFDQHPLERMRTAGAPAAEIREYEATLGKIGDLSSHRVIASSLGAALRARRHDPRLRFVHVAPRPVLRTALSATVVPPR